jgi:hypothetical protein
MPGFNGTGPRGFGPMTGRGMGYCVLPYSSHGENGSAFVVTNKSVVDVLRGQAEYLQNQLEQTKKRLAELERAGKEKEK